MKTINFIKIFDNDRMTAMVTDCWSRGLKENDCLETLELNASLFKGKHYTKRMISSIYILLDEQEKIDLSQV